MIVQSKIICLILSMMMAVFMLVNANDTTKPKTLVIVDSISIKNTHESFFNQLQKVSDINVVTAQSKNWELEQYGEPQYDNVVLMTPKLTSKFNFLIDNSHRKR